MKTKKEDNMDVRYEKTNLEINRNKPIFLIHSLNHSLIPKSLN